MDPRVQTQSDLREQLQALTQENLKLCERNELLFTKVSYLESRLGHLASSSTDLSCRLVQSEEDKLKISKELVEEKIQRNKMREQFEEETFELKNKLLNQAGALTELEMDRARLLRELQAAEARLEVGERSGRDLAEECAALRRNHQALAEAHQKELLQSEELSGELLALAQAQDALRRQVEEQQHSAWSTARGLQGELDRVRALVSSMAHHRVQCKDLSAVTPGEKDTERTLLGNQEEIKNTLEKMKNSYEEQQRKLEEKVVVMGKEQQENQRVIRERQRELSEQRAVLLCSQNKVKQVEEENSKLQLRVKELNEEFRARLVSYLQDLAGYADKLRAGEGPSEVPQMREFVDSMIQEVRSSYRTREEQLASAARSYKKRLQKITETHHALLILYRVQREQILAEPGSGLDPGPPEAALSLDPAELREETEKELLHLRQDKARLEARLQDARQQMADIRMPAEIPGLEPAKLEEICVESGRDIKKQLREITGSTLADFEKERALLITRASVAEAQVSEMQDYIENHLIRYKEEISRLCSQQGTHKAGRSQSAYSALQ